MPSPRRRIFPTALAAASLVVIACSSTMAVYPVDYGRLTAEQKGAPGCRARLVDSMAEIPKGCVTVGDVFIGDDGSAMGGCGEERVRGDLEIEACKLGGHVALVREVHDPNTMCFEARAIAFHCEAPDRAPEVTP